MKNRKKTQRYKQIWFSVWNSKTFGQSPQCEMVNQPAKISNR